jgi:hypothetical protein
VEFTVIRSLKIPSLRLVVRLPLTTNNIDKQYSEGERKERERERNKEKENKNNERTNKVRKEQKNRIKKMTTFIVVNVVAIAIRRQRM